jgi:hypothetical protein
MHERSSMIRYFVDHGVSLLLGHFGGGGAGLLQTLSSRAASACSTEVQAELPCMLSKLLARNPQEAAGRTLYPQLVKGHDINRYCTLQ